MFFSRFTGAHFHDSEDPHSEYELKMSSDHNLIVVSNGHHPIALKDILEVKTLHGALLHVCVCVCVCVCLKQMMIPGFIHIQTIKSHVYVEN